MNVVIFIVTLFFSDGTYTTVAKTKADPPKAECAALAKGAPAYFAGKPFDGHGVVVGTDARCIVVPRVSNL